MKACAHIFAKLAGFKCQKLQCGRYRGNRIAQHGNVTLAARTHAHVCTQAHACACCFEVVHAVILSESHLTMRLSNHSHDEQQHHKVYKQACVEYHN